jgi:hypothetical protein
MPRLEGESDCVLHLTPDNLRRVAAIASVVFRGHSHFSPMLARGGIWFDDWLSMTSVCLSRARW